MIQYNIDMDKEQFDFKMVGDLPTLLADAGTMIKAVYDGIKEQSSIDAEMFRFGLSQTLKTDIIFNDNSHKDLISELKELKRKEMEN